MSKTKIKVKVVGGTDFGISGMFRQYVDPKKKKEYVLLIDDMSNEPDLLVFTGGADINPKLYGENAISRTHYSDNRDAEDKFWYSKYPKIPKVGICRGGQFLNVMSGGAMWQHVERHGMPHEAINLLPIGKSWAQGDTVRVTSTHHQMMIPAADGEVLAIAMNKEKTKGLADVYLSGTSRQKPDFDTEVVWYEKTKSLCYQPHPEYHGYADNRKYFFDLLDHFYFGE